MLEAQRHPAAEIEVRRAADAAVEDVHALRQQHTQQAIADRRRRRQRDLDPLAGRHGDPVVDRAEDRRGPIVLAFLVRLQGVGLDDDRVAAGEIQHEERPRVHELGGHAVDFGGARAIEQERRLVAPVVEDAVEHEARRIRRRERQLAGGAEHAAQVIDEPRPGSRPVDHLDRGIAPRRREKMRHRRALGPPHVGEDSRGGQRARVRRDDGCGGNAGLDRGEDPALEREILGRGLDHPVAIGDGVVVGLVLTLRVTAAASAAVILPRATAFARNRRNAFAPRRVRAAQCRSASARARERALQVIADVGPDRAGAMMATCRGSGRTGAWRRGFAYEGSRQSPGGGRAPGFIACRRYRAGRHRRQRAHRDARQAGGDQDLPEAAEIDGERHDPREAGRDDPGSSAPATWPRPAPAPRAGSANTRRRPPAADQRAPVCAAARPRHEASIIEPSAPMVNACSQPCPRASKPRSRRPRRRNASTIHP